MKIYHNDNDKACCALLRKRFPDSVVDERSIKDVRPEDLREYRQCHFFAGIGGFSLAFQQAGIGADVNVWTGGFPCQDLSIAGKREGLAGERSGLWFEFHRLLSECKPRWVVIENVPGLLSSNEGKDFAIILGGLTGILPEVPADGWGNAGFARGPVYSVAYRVLDAQFFGVPQRRRRVFIVASLGSGSCGEVLFESESMSWDTPQGRKAGAGSPSEIVGSFDSGGSGSPRGHGGAWPGTTVESAMQGHAFPALAHALSASKTATGRLDPNGQDFIVAGTLSSDYAKTGGNGMGEMENGILPFDLAQITSNVNRDTCEPGSPMSPLNTAGQKHVVIPNVARPLCTGNTNDHFDESQQTYVVAFSNVSDGSSARNADDKCDPLTGRHGDPGMVAYNIQQNDGGEHKRKDRPNGGMYVQETDQSLTVGGPTQPVIVFDGRNMQAQDEVSPTLQSKKTGGYSLNMQPMVLDGITEDETLQSKGIEHIIDEKGDPLYASTHKTNPREILSILRKEIGEEAFTQWGFGILNTLQQAKILQSPMYGKGFRSTGNNKQSELGNVSLSCQKINTSWTLRKMWIKECARCSSQGWKPSKQFYRELRTYLSELSQPGTSQAKALYNMWYASKGIGILQQAFLEIQEIWKSSYVQKKSTYSSYGVRRLTPKEAERLQGFPDDFTAGQSDSARYRQLGNAVAVPCVRWIAKRIVRYNT